MWYPRAIKEKISLLSTKFPVIVLTGARQTGKTSLLKRLFKHHTYVSLDVPSRAEQAEHDPALFLSEHEAPILIDEVQYAPKLFRHLKVAVDDARHEMGRFVLTGSQKFVLMKEVTESLAGRTAVLDLETLSVAEIQQGPQLGTPLMQLERIIARGGFPELWRDPDIPVGAFYDGYVATYLERDVRQILNVTSLRDFERFLRACAARNAQTLDQSALAADVGVSLKAIRSWLSVLCASNQIVLLEPWFANVGKRLVKTPKLYFCDVGLVSYLLGVTASNLAASPFVGALWETLVFAELRKLLSLLDAHRAVWFYRDRQQVEVDFLITGGGDAVLLECKWTEEPSPRDFRSMERVIAAATSKNHPDFSRARSAVVCRVARQTPYGNNRRSLPVDDLPRFVEQ